MVDGLRKNERRELVMKRVEGKTERKGLSLKNHPDDPNKNNPRYLTALLKGE